MSENKIKVLICDDSALIRKILTSILSSDPDIEVVATAIDATSAREKIKKYNPDVLTLDIEMPGMDGLSFLEKIMTLRPMPVIMISSLTQKGTAQTMKAMELGVFEVVGKPTSGLTEDFNNISHSIISYVKAAAKSKVVPLEKRTIVTKSTEANASPHVDLIAIGASTGGVVALREIIPHISTYSPPVVVTQHMPAGYTASFAKRLNEHSEITVIEAQGDEILKNGHVYIAPGDTHLTVVKKGKLLKTKVYEGELVSGHMPSVDEMFNSITKLDASRVIGVILTGMGRDGASGLLNLRQQGAVTIGQDEATCIVYGMPRVAAEVGATSTILPLHKIATEIKKICWPAI